VASICIETPIQAPVADAWDALRDWGALHERLAPGFVTDTEVEGEDRLVTFFTGATVRETILDVDDDRRRLAWTIVDGPYSHHNGVAQMLERSGSTVLVWTTDLLPHAAADRTRELMEHGSAVIKATLESTPNRTQPK
jgi:Polyketide cyclase / dehydrase and lipid transport